MFFPLSQTTQVTQDTGVVVSPVVVTDGVGVSSQTTFGRRPKPRFKDENGGSVFVCRGVASPSSRQKPSTVFALGDAADCLKSVSQKAEKFVGDAHDQRQTSPSFARDDAQVSSRLRPTRTANARATARWISLRRFGVGRCGVRRFFAEGSVTPLAFRNVSNARFWHEKTFHAEGFKGEGAAFPLQAATVRPTSAERECPDAVHACVFSEGAFPLSGQFGRTNCVLDIASRVSL